MSDLARLSTILALVLSLGSSAHAQVRTFALEVVGPQANGGKEQRCREVFQRGGYEVSPTAPLRVRLTLAPFANRLEVFSARRGAVYNQVKPGWGMGELCQDALSVATGLLSQENAPPAASSAPPPSPYAPPPSAYAPAPSASRIAFDVVGPMANARKQQDCVSAAQRSGLEIDPRAPVRVVLTLNPGVNQLQITSARRGVVVNTNRPPWGMGTLCQDAVAEAQRALAQEGQPPLTQYPVAQYQASQYQAPPSAPALTLGPIPPTKELPPVARQAAERAVNAWKAAQFEAALDAFREAARASNDPQLLFDRAVCEQRLGRYAEAQSHVQLFLDMAPQSPYRPYADQLAAELQRQAAPAPVAPPPQTVVAPTIQISPGYVGPGYIGPGYVGPGYVGPGYVGPGYPGVVVPMQNFCKWGTDCGAGQFCRDRGDGVKMCMGNGVRNSICVWGTDCGGGLFCRDPGNGMKVCM